MIFFQHEMKKNFQKTLAGSHVTQQTDIQRYTHKTTVFKFSKRRAFTNDVKKSLKSVSEI